MNKNDIRKEEAESERIEEEYRENNQRSFRVKFKGCLYVEAIDKDEAISRAKDKDDLIDWVDDWEAE